MTSWALFTALLLPFYIPFGVYGGLVAILQSAGVLGLGSTTSVVAGSVASGATAAVTFLRK